MGRRQVTAFLPGELGARVDEVRARWDPEMARRIAAHITLVHDPPADEVLRSGLDLVAARPPLRARLTEARCWGTPEHGIYLGVEDAHGDIARVRELLGIVDGPEVRYEPHVTIVHPRTADPSQALQAWDRLAGWVIEEMVVFDRVHVIEFQGSRWQSVAEVPSTRE